MEGRAHASSDASIEMFLRTRDFFQMIGTTFIVYEWLLEHSGCYTGVSRFTATHMHGSSLYSLSPNSRGGIVSSVLISP